MAKQPEIAILIDRFGHPLRPYTTQVVEALQIQASGQIRLYADEIDYQTSPKVIQLKSQSAWQRGRNFIVRVAESPTAALAWLRTRNRHSLRKRLITWGDYAPLIRHRPPVIHLIMAQRFPFIEPILEAYGAKVVVSFRGDDALIMPLNNASWRKTLNRIFDRASYLHGVSQHICNRLIDLGAPAEKTVTIYRSIDFEEFTAEPQEPTQTETTTILSVGRLTWQKGHLYAIHAIRLLIDKGFHIKYRIAGEGPERDHLSFWIKKLHLENDVELLGEQPRAVIKNLLCNSSIFLHPAVYEGVPNAILEASAMELPIIAAAIDGVPEAVKDNTTGILVPPANPKALANALMNLLQQPNQRKEMGKQGRRHIAEKFTRQREIEEWLALYRSLL